MTNARIRLAGFDLPSILERPGHALHGSDRLYPETNCYADLVVELLHARGDEPLAVLGCCAALDFEGDQFTFFKPPPEELQALFGIDVHEMQPYRALEQQLRELLPTGRTVTVEVDSWYLPDTAATDYRTNHVKSSIAPLALDPDDQVLHYVHGRGVFTLTGEDYRGALRLEPLPAVALPPYTELVRFDAGPRLGGTELQAAARELLAGHLRRAPGAAAVHRFGEHLDASLPDLLAGTEADFHAYAFASVRMLGAAAGALELQARWLFPSAAAAIAACDAVTGSCKVLSFRLARRRPFDPAPIVVELAVQWQAVLEQLDALVA
ncbi:MAG: DUF1839 family protein [Frankiaceae bacterium]|nr:DUF1839 family protein [Frankiaceae bacterium]